MAEKKQAEKEEKEEKALVQVIPHNVVVTDFDDDTITKWDYELYKGTKGVTDRIALLMPLDPPPGRSEPVPFVPWGRTHFTSETNYFMCHSDYGKVGGLEVCNRSAPCCQALGAPKKRFAVMVLHYQTDQNGNLTKPYAYKLKVWKFGEERYRSIKATNKEFPLHAHDLKLTCEDTQYQKMTLTACKESIWRHPDVFEQEGDAVLTWVRSMISPRGELPNKLCEAVAKAYTDKELHEALGAGPSAGARPVSDDGSVNISDILSIE